MAVIDILLATYNGAAWLPEQLASLERQSFRDWRLIVRDDGSSDGTPQVLADWARTSGREVLILEDGEPGLGASANFARLLEASDASYFAFCDQDDVWLPHKLQVMLEALQQEESGASGQEPLLAYSDLRVVDARLREIASSFRRFSRRPILTRGRELDQIMLHNVVTGCASLGNAALRRASLPIPAEALMHDWWLALIAAGLGRLVDVPQATILYRQHGANTLGANANDPLSLAIYAARRPAMAIRRSRDLLRGTQRQAGAFAERQSARLTAEQVRLLEGYAHLGRRSFVERKAFFLRYRLLDGNGLKNLPFLVLA